VSRPLGVRSLAVAVQCRPAAHRTETVRERIGKRNFASSEESVGH
jgi:hypothetical protein